MGEPDSNGIISVGIYSSNLDGSNKKLRCSAGGNAKFDLVRWSPRNRYIVWNHTQNGPGGLNFCNLENGKSSPVFSDRSGAASKVFDWTPDGENALWQAGDNYSDLNLYYGDPDKGGKDANQLTNSQNRYNLNYPNGDPAFSYYLAARFSPDGKTIAVGGDKIFFISTPGQKSPFEGKVIGGIGKFGIGLAWSPDGKAVAYSDGDTKTIKIVDITSGKVTTLEDTGILGDWTRQ
jgi:WD40 repeat protein